MAVKGPDKSGKPAYELNSPPSVGTIINVAADKPQKTPKVIDEKDVLRYGQNKPRKEIIYAIIEKREQI